MMVSARARIDLTPLTGAVVTVSGQQVSATTDDSGQFLLDGVYTGTRQFYVECDGYTRATFSMDIAEGPNAIPSSVNLEPATLKWMVMVYMAADNDLDYAGNYALQDLNEMEMAPNSPDVMTLVLADRYGPNNTRLYRMEQDSNPSSVTSPVIYNPGELNTGDVATLGWFVNYCQTDPDLPRAEHYMLVLWNHGSGWSSYDDRTLSLRAIGIDDSSGGDIMRIIDIPPVLTQPYPFDIIATDACLMNQLEVAYEWRTRGDFLIGSEELTAGDGYDYNRVLTFINSSEALQMAVEQFAGGVAQQVFNGWQANYGPGSIPPVNSVIDLRRLDAVASALDALSGRLLAIGDNNTAKVQSAYESAQQFGYSWDDHRVDLYHYADLLSSKISDSQLRSAASQLKTAVTSAVTTNLQTSLRPHAHGISIYLPTITAYNRDAAGSYPGLQLSIDTRWNEWLANQPSW
jgi:hypothetical protein